MVAHIASHDPHLTANRLARRAAEPTRRTERFNGNDERNVLHGDSSCAVLDDHKPHIFSSFVLLLRSVWLGYSNTIRFLIQSKCKRRNSSPNMFISIVCVLALSLGRFRAAESVKIARKNTAAAAAAGGRQTY